MSEPAILRNFQLAYALRGAAVAASVLHVGAHPDDEDAGMLALISRGWGARAIYWSATRGEGAQNYVGPDKNERLGIVRTWESMAAREFDGGEVRYGPFIDFGFTKTGELALAKWGRETVIRELVRVIRQVQPVVVVNRWSGSPDDGHGHHQAIGMVSQEAFEAAADAERFPELGLPPWTALKLYHSMGGDWQPGEDVRLGAMVPEYEARALLRIDTGDTDPVSGNTFQELAARGYNCHRSQAMGSVPERDRYFAYYALDRSRLPAPEAPETSFFDGVDSSLSGLSSWPNLPGTCVAEELSTAASAARGAWHVFHPADPTRSAPDLIRALAALRDAMRILAASDETGADALLVMLERKERDLEWATTRCLGLDLQADLTARLVNPGISVGLTVRLRNTTEARLERLQLGVEAPAEWSTTQVSEAEDGDGVSIGEYAIEVPIDAQFSCPYWLRQGHDPYRYAWPDDRTAGGALDPAQLKGTATFTVGGQRLRMEDAALAREAFGGGYRELPLSVLPPIALAPERTSEFLPLDRAAGVHQLRLTLRCNQVGGEKGELHVTLPDGWEVSPAQLDIELLAVGETHTVALDVSLPTSVEVGRYQLDYGIQTDGLVYGASLYPVRSAAPGLARPADEHTCVEEVYITEPASVEFHIVNVDFVRKLKYGYITGLADGILSTLRNFDLDLEELDDEHLRFGELAQYDAIVVGPNAFLLRDVLRSHGARLLEYAEAGGTVIVQHQGYEFEKEGWAPYPFHYRQPHDRVTFEDAPVKILMPDHALLHVPNELTPADWSGWVKDRGMYFFGEFDDRYLPILECADPDESPQPGGLLVADVGQGNWVYCAYSLWKQMPAGVPGGIRLFANLLGLPHSRILERARLLLGITLFESMSEAHRYDIARLMSDHHLNDGDILCRQGEAGDEMFIIVEGEIEIVKVSPAHPEGATIAVAGAGDAVGELSVLASRARSATMRARGQVRLLKIWGPAFRDLVHGAPEIADRLIQTLVEKLASTPAES